MTHLFINPENEYPRHPGDIFLTNPDYDGVNLPEGWKAVQPTEPPQIEEQEVLFEVFPELTDGIYLQKWETRPMTPEEIEQNNNPPQSWEDVRKTLGI